MSILINLHLQLLFYVIYIQSQLDLRCNITLFMKNAFSQKPLSLILTQKPLEPDLNSKRIFELNHVAIPDSGTDTHPDTDFAPCLNMRTDKFWRAAFIFKSYMFDFWGRKTYQIVTVTRKRSV